MLELEDRARMSGCTQEATGVPGVKVNAPGVRGKEVIFHWGGRGGGGVGDSSFREEMAFKQVERPPASEDNVGIT